MTATPPAVPREDAPPVHTFPALDSLRAVGALAVLTTHVAFVSGAYTRHGTVGALLSRLDVGVALFFVLSGFLLARPWLSRAAAGAPAPHAGRYLWKRLLRIYPIYVVTVVLTLSLVIRNRGSSPADWLTTLLLADVFRSASLPVGLTHMWSLSVEVCFYLLLPVLMVLAVGGGRRLRPWRVLAVLASMVLVSGSWHLWWAADAGAHLSGSPLQWLPAFLTWFAVGIALALCHVRSTDPRPPGRAVRAAVSLGRMPGCCWALALGLLLVSTTPVAGPILLSPPDSAQSLTKSLLYAAIGGLVVLPGVFGPPSGLFATVFGLPWFRRLGVISFGIFCLHLPLLTLVQWITGWPLFGGHGIELWLITTALSIAAAELAYRLVERPAMRLRSWSPRLGRGHAPSEDSSAKSAATGSSTR